MSGIMEWVDACSWWQIGLLMIGVTLMMLCVIVLMEAAFGCRERYWGGQ